MKLTRDFVANIHRTIEKFPVEKEKLELLYPDAFQEARITTSVKFEITTTGHECKVHLIYRSVEIGELRLGERPGYFFRTTEEVSKEHLDTRKAMHTSASWKIKPGYEVRFTGTGFTIIRYGPEPEKPKEAK